MLSDQFLSNQADMPVLKNYDLPAKVELSDSCPASSYAAPIDQTEFFSEDQSV